jgi:hypothetical protein
VDMNNNPWQSGIHFRTKTNRYIRPHTVVRYATGSHATNLYHFDFSRPITNSSGLRTGGSQLRSRGYQNTGGSDILSMYGNAYSTIFIPLRLDVLYLDGTTDMVIPQDTTLVIQRDNTFLDAAITTGNAHHSVVLFHTRMSTDFTDSLSLPMYEHTARIFGFETRHCYPVLGFHMSNRLRAALRFFESNVYGSHEPHSVEAGFSIDRSFGCFNLSTKAGFELDDQRHTYPSLRGEGRMRLFDGTDLYAAVGRDYQRPSIAERSLPDIPSFWLRGDTTLTTAYRIVQECGLTSSGLSCTVYKYDYDQFIAWQQDATGTYVPHGLADWQTIGIEGSGTITVHLGSYRENAYTALELAAWGNHLFTGDSIPLIPQTHAGFYAALERHTDRFGARAAFIGSTSSDRLGFSDASLDGYNTFTAIGTLRFVTLSFTLRVDNLFDSQYEVLPEYDAAGRTMVFFINWEFWD